MTLGAQGYVLNGVKIDAGPAEVVRILVKAVMVGIILETGILRL